MELSSLEKQLLQSVDADSRNDEEELRRYQKEALKQLRGAFRYMQEKYPDTEIRWRLFDPLTRITERGVLICSLPDHTSFHKINILLRQNEYVYSDTLYGDLIRDRYDEAVCMCLKEFIPNIKAYTVFYTSCGSEISGRSSLSEIISHVPLLVRHTDLFVCPPAGITAEAADALRKEGFFGAYSIYSTDDRELFEQGSYEQLRASSIRSNFNLFEGPKEGTAS